MKKKTKHNILIGLQIVAGAFIVLLPIILGVRFLFSIDFSAGESVNASQPKFVLKDDPEKKGSNPYVVEENIDGDVNYYIKIGDRKSQIIDEEFQNKLKESLSGTSKNNMKNIEIPMDDSSTLSNIDISIDITSPVDENINSFNKIIDKTPSFQELTVRLYGGNEKMISAEKLNIKYSPPSMKMYQAEYPRSNSYYVYVGEIFDMGLDVESLKEQVEKFIREGSENAEIDQKAYLIEHLKRVQRDNVNGKIIILTSGDYLRFQSSNFINNDFEAYRKKQNYRWYEIKVAKEKLAQGEEVRVPSPLPSYFYNFNTELKNEFSVFKDACLALTDKGAELDKHVFYQEKIKLFDDLNLYCN